MRSGSETRALFSMCCCLVDFLLSYRCLLLWGLALRDAFSLSFGLLSILQLLLSLLLSLLLYKSKVILCCYLYYVNVSYIQLTIIVSGLSYNYLRLSTLTLKLVLP